MSSYSQATRANTPTIGIPKYVTTQSTFTADNSSNQMFVQTEPYLDNIVHHEWFNNGSASSSSLFDMKSLTGFGSYSNLQLFQLPNSGILQFVNGSDNTMQLKYKAQFFNMFNVQTQSLSGQSNPTQYDGIALQSGMIYAFKIDVTEMTPMILSILTSEINGGTSYNMAVNIISPSGVVYPNTFGITRNVAELIPLLPRELGTYILTLSPDTDVILGAINLDTNPTITSISNGMSENLKGTESTAKVFKLAAPSTAFSYIELHSTTFQSEYLGGLPYLGQISITYFAPNSQSPFATDFSGFTITNKALYIVVTAQPPDDSDPSIKAAKKNAGLGNGFDLQYSFWIVSHLLSDLKIGQDFTTFPEASYSNSLIYYNLKIQNDTAIGVNGTGISARIYSTDPLNPIYINNNNHYVSISSGSNDLLNSNTNNLIILQKGDYYVRAFTYEVMRFTTANILTIGNNTENSPTSSLNVTSTYYQPYIVYLPAIGFSYDYLNITNLDHLNQSARYRLSWFSETGNYFGGTSSINNLYYYYDTGVLQSQNATFKIAPSYTTFPSIDVGYNTAGLYLRVNIDLNAKYNATAFPVTQNNQSIMSSIEIRRQNYISILQNGSQSDMFIQNSLDVGQSASRFVYANNATVLGYYSFLSTENTAYNLTINCENRTIRYAYLRLDSSTIWFGNSQTTATLIDNITHYIINLEFATTKSINIGLYIRFWPSTENGTLVVGLNSMKIFKLPDLGLSSIVAFGVKPKSNIFTNPLTYIIAGGGVVLIALIALLVKRGVFSSIISKIRP